VNYIIILSAALILGAVVTATTTAVSAQSPFPTAPGKCLNDLRGVEGINFFDALHACTPSQTPR